MKKRRKPTHPKHVGELYGEKASPDANTPIDCTTKKCPDTILLEIYDRKTGKLVSGTTQKKIVGQKVELQVRTNPVGKTITNIQWTVPGQKVKAYTQTTTAAVRTDHTTADLQAVDVDFYWIESGNRAVQVTAKVEGVLKAASVTYQVLAPTSLSMTSVTGTIAVSNPGFPGAGLELHYGTTSTPGIRWTLTATAPIDGAGEIAGTQMVNTVRTITPNGRSPLTLTSSGAFVLDTHVPYASQTTTIGSNSSATWISEDSPGSNLTAAMESVSVNDLFRIYFMYKPDGADSIWVTLMRLEWHWKGKTTRIGVPASTANNWNAVTDTSSMTNPSGQASTELPIWNTNVTNLTLH